VVFSSLEFLLRFLPATLLLYFVVPKRFRNALLVIASLVFYAWGEPVHVLLLLFSTAINYVLGTAIDRHRGSTRATAALAASVALNVALLGFFKYSDFVIANLNNLLGSSISLLKAPLPVGISFYTFKILSYSIDVYRDDATAAQDPAAFLLYVSLFPQVMAGPIERYGAIAHELQNREHSLDQFAAGVHRFVLGLGKKVIIADNVALLWDACRTTAAPAVMSSWLGIVAFAFQLYFDFSGYSDMAVGLGRMLGFHLAENFHFPYMSQSIAEFWRRWHITLGQWFRDYVYIPLGGNRVAPRTWIRNMLVVWFLTGLWHGASWNFVLWGAYFGALLTIERLLLGKLLRRLPRLLRHAYTLVAVLVSWVIFSLGSISDITLYLGNMFGLRSLELVNVESLYLLRSNSVLLLLAAVASTPLLSDFYATVRDKSFVRTVVMPLLYAAVLTVSVAYVVDSSFNPFLYFRF
jgi:alginate O-acetyltransferase complex protein AlgI